MTLAIDAYFEPVPAACDVKEAAPADVARAMPDLPIRLATPEDGDEILRLLTMLHEENGQHPINLERVIDWIGPYIQQDGGILAVIGEPDNIYAMLCLVIDDIWYSEDKQLLEMFNYVRPDARRSNYARRMIEFAKKCSEETGLDLTIGVMSNVRMEAKVRLYSRLIQKAGEFFVHVPNRAAR